MKKVIKFALLLVMTISVPTFASEKGQENIPHSLEIDGEMIYDLGSNKTTVKDKESNININSIAPVYIQDGFVEGSITAEDAGYDLYNKLYYNTSVEIPFGVNYTFTWEEEVTETNTSSNTVGGSVRAQGGFKFITELEATVRYDHTWSEEVTRTMGTKSSLGFMEPGFYNVDWYMKANKYTMYCDWWMWSDYGDNYISWRNIGTLYEPTNFLHVKITSIN